MFHDVLLLHAIIFPLLGLILKTSLLISRMKYIRRCILCFLVPLVIATFLLYALSATESEHTVYVSAFLHVKMSRKRNN